MQMYQTNNLHTYCNGILLPYILCNLSFSIIIIRDSMMKQNVIDISQKFIEVLHFYIYEKFNVFKNNFRPISKFYISLNEC